MKCRIDQDNKERSQGLIVRRKFVPLKFSILRENQFLNAGTKLPFTSCKLIGMLIGAKVTDPCIDMPAPPRFYYGLSASKMTDTRFLDTHPGELFNDTYPPNIQIDQNTSGNEWWFYAAPETDIYPFLFTNEYEDSIGDPIRLEITEEGHCNPETYYLWSQPFYGYMSISFHEDT